MNNFESNIQLNNISSRNNCEFHSYFELMAFVCQFMIKKCKSLIADGLIADLLRRVKVLSFLIFVNNFSREGFSELKYFLNISFLILNRPSLKQTPKPETNQ